MEENNSLTPREQEILNLLIEGIAPKEIAYKTKISIKTVAFHRTNIYRKTGIKNKYELKAKYSALNKLPEDKVAQQPVIYYQNKKKLIPAVLLLTVIFIFSIWFIFIKPNLFMTRGKTPQEPVFIDRTFRILNLKSSR